MEDFAGAKGALFHDGCVVVLRRDDIPTIRWPGLIDLPGGMREPGERPEDTLLREIEEEIGLRLPRERLGWSRRYVGDKGPTWFFAVSLHREEPASMRLGDEGQALWMMPVGDYLGASDAIPVLQSRLRDVLSERPLGDW